MSELCRLSVQEIRDLCAKGSATPEEVVGSVMARIDAIDPALKAVIETYRGSLPERLRAAAGKKGAPLYGVPVLLKDNICVRGEEATCASRILKGFRSPYNATVIDRLEEAGAILLGRTNMDEFAFGSSCETSCYGPTRNPWNTQRIPGGSSGGSAAAVSADETIVALGSDTGGSIRQPAALCGVVGLKPTYGRVSRYGLIAFASSLDQIGPLTKTVTDAAIMLNVIGGYDPRDSSSAPVAMPDFTKALVNDVKGLRIGIPDEYFANAIDDEVASALAAARKKLESLGARCERISLPHTSSAVSVYYVLAPAEASSNLARFDGVRYGLRLSGPGEPLAQMYRRTRSQGFGPEAKRRIILGTYVLSSGYYDAYYLKALKVRTRIKEDFDEAFKRCDCILTPTAPTPAFKIGEKVDDPLSMYLSDIFTIPVNLAGIPAISLPCGLTTGGLPIGMQVIAKAFDEETLLRTAYTYEQNTEWHKKRPPL